MIGAAASILIVDDESPNRRVLEAFLRPEGYETVSVASAAAVSKPLPAPDLEALLRTKRRLPSSNGVGAQLPALAVGK